MGISRWAVLGLVEVAAVAPGTIERVGVSSSGVQPDGISGRRSQPALNRGWERRRVRPPRLQLVRGTLGGRREAVIHGRPAETTEPVSVDLSGQGNGRSAPPDISADGRFVAFGSFSPNLVPGDTNDAFDVFVRDRACQR